MTTSPNAPDGTALLERAQALLDAGRPAAARPMLNAAVRIAGPGEMSWHLQARLLLREGDAAGACALLDDALDALPESVPLLLARAAARHRLGDLRGAAGDAAGAVLANPRSAQAKATLGAVLGDLGEHEDARACLAEAARAEPADANYCFGLAREEEACGDADAAARTLAEGVARLPRALPLRVAAIGLALRRQDFAAAEAAAAETCRAGLADATVFALLGEAHAGRGNFVAAATAFAQARKLAPEMPGLRELAATAADLASASASGPARP